MLEMFFYEYEEEVWNRYASCFEDVNTQIDGVPQHHPAEVGSGQHFPGGNHMDHTHIYNIHVPYEYR